MLVNVFSPAVQLIGGVFCKIMMAIAVEKFLGSIIFTTKNQFTCATASQASMGFYCLIPNLMITVRAIYHFQSTL